MGLRDCEDGGRGQGSSLLAARTVAWLAAVRSTRSDGAAYVADAPQPISDAQVSDETLTMRYEGTCRVQSPGAPYKRCERFAVMSRLSQLNLST